MGYRVRRVRKSRSRHRRRLRHVSALLLVALIMGCGWLVSQHSLFSTSYFSKAKAGSDWERGNASRNLAILAGPTASEVPVTDNAHPLYPYSVVPGGVHSVRELREASQRDRVVARHYEGFNFNQARIIELKHAQMVYLAYRIGNRIFWTRKQVALRQGEKLITDGKIAARTRCGNRVVTLPQAVVSPAEPRAEKFEQPITMGSSAKQIAFPGSFESALQTRPPLSGFGGAGPTGPGAGPVFGPTGGGGFPGISPPPIPGGTCEPIKKPKPKPRLGGGEPLADDATPNKKKKKCVPGGHPTTVPEPGTILLVSSGLAGIYVRRRKAAARRRSQTQSAPTPN